MTSISETGHAKNIGNFQNLISFCEGYADAYSPIKESLKIPQLHALYEEAQDKLQTVKIQKTTFDDATNSRRIAFADLKPLATRIINAFSVSGADPLAIADAKAVNKKIQGKSKPKKPKSAPENPEPADGISTSQQSYDRLIDHFANLIEILGQHSTYTPNEDDLKLTVLQTKLADLQAENTALISAYTPYSNAMILRNQTLYNPLTGLVRTAKEVKTYIKSVFGANSPQYKQVSDLEFKVQKN